MEQRSLPHLTKQVRSFYWHIPQLDRKAGPKVLGFLTRNNVSTCRKGKLDEGRRAMRCCGDLRVLSSILQVRSSQESICALKLVPLQTHVRSDRLSQFAGGSKPNGMQFCYKSKLDAYCSHNHRTLAAHGGQLRRSVTLTVVL